MREPRHPVLPIVTAALLLAAPALADERPDISPPQCAVLFEDDPEGLLRHLQGQSGGEGSAELANVFSGRAAVKIIPMQRYGQVPGWNFRIAEKPGPGEYRFVRFAWRADGSDGIMVQFHVETGWSVRYVAGNNVPGWGAKEVATVAPPGWTVVTRDLFGEFGPCTVSGIALSVFGGNAGYFDHVYLGRTVEDLDRIDATGLRDAPPGKLDDAELDRLWIQLGGDDAAAAYRAFWTMVAVPEQAVPFIRRACAPPDSPETLREIKQWINDLDADDFETREQATRKLQVHLEAAARLLRKEKASAGLEARIRIERLLHPADDVGNVPNRTAKAISILKNIDTSAARALLAELGETREE